MFQLRHPAEEKPVRAGEGGGCLTSHNIPPLQPGQGFEPCEWAAVFGAEPQVFALIAAPEGCSQPGCLCLWQRPPALCKGARPHKVLVGGPWAGGKGALSQAQWVSALVLVGDAPLWEGLHGAAAPRNGTGVGTRVFL